MKNRSVSLYLLTATLFAVLVLAQDAPSPAPRLPDGVPAPRAEVLKRFDANHDGKLDDIERAAAREAWRKRQTEYPGAWSGPGHAGWAGPQPGGDVCWGREKLQQYRRSQFSSRMQMPLRRMMQQRMIQRFDADHDGRLSDTERARARQARQEFLKQHPVIARGAPVPSAQAK